eukprot:g7887.t1
MAIGAEPLDSEQRAEASSPRTRGKETSSVGDGDLPGDLSPTDLLPDHYDYDDAANDPQTATLQQLLSLDDEYAFVHKQMEAEIKRVRDGYRKKFSDNLTARGTLLSRQVGEGEEEPEYLEFTNRLGTPAVPSFWLETLRHSELKAFVFEQDCNCLEYLTDVVVSASRACSTSTLESKETKTPALLDEASSASTTDVASCDAGAESEKEKADDEDADASSSEPALQTLTATLFFKSDTNPYFSNEKVCKTVTVRPRKWMEAVDVVSVKCDPILWKEGKSLVAPKSKSGGKKGSKGRGRGAPRPDEVRESFFSLFFRDLEEGQAETSRSASATKNALYAHEKQLCAEEEEEESEYVLQLLSEHYDAMVTLQKSIVPHAVRYYNREVVGEWSDSEEEDDDDTAGAETGEEE